MTTVVAEAPVTDPTQAPPPPSEAIPGAPSRTAAIRMALAIEGWLSAREAGLLYDLARAARQPIVEIGCWRGRSTAALALGSAAGHRQPIYSIDPFLGVAPGPRLEALKCPAGPDGCSRALVMENLARLGVDDLVTVIPTTSPVAAPCIPSCGLLFIDGDHSAAAVRQDLADYLPKVLPGGTVVMHDVSPEEPGVTGAIDELILPHTDTWTIRQRVDITAVIRRQTYARRSIYLAVPGRGFDWAPVGSLMEASRLHNVSAGNNANGWDDFNALWAQALNRFEAGQCTHFAMVHADVAAEPGWLDLLMAEMEDRRADLVSCIIPIKDDRGLTSSGIADPRDRWGPFRRLTLREAMDLPETFGVEELRPLGADPAAGRYLLHNTGCWVCDLRNPLFRQTDAAGALKCFFDFPTRVARNLQGQGEWAHWRESEDWYFSRRIGELGARTFMTRAVAVAHYGAAAFSNTSPWGSYAIDRDTQHKWGPVPAPGTSAALPSVA